MKVVLSKLDRHLAPENTSNTIMKQH